MPDRALASVVVASHARPLRARWLLNALWEQDLDGPWELIVVHDYDPAVAARLFDAHPLARAGRLRHEAIAPGTGSPARQRNVGWRLARAPLVAFTDDDCRPEPGWLSALVAAAAREPGAVVQGATRPDPYERALLLGPHPRTLDVPDPPGRWAQTCNILYPRALLERLGGFDETLVAGEDVDLSLRARAAGTRVAGAPEALVNHAVESHSLPGIVRINWKWRYLAYLAKRHPRVRRHCTLGVFWEPEHLEAVIAVAGLAAARRRPALAGLALPYFSRMTRRRRGPSVAAQVLATLELPGRLAQELAEVATMAAGSARFRTLVL
jgi:hypothetical protein